ncbi:hypothetical protein OAD26_00575 [bacterium]|nr:hypothetical protein [bacterium]
MKEMYKCNVCKGLHDHVVKATRCAARNANEPYEKGTTVYYGRLKAEITEHKLEKYTHINTYRIWIDLDKNKGKVVWQVPTWVRENKLGIHEATIA